MTTTSGIPGNVTGRRCPDGHLLRPASPTSTTLTCHTCTYPTGEQVEAYRDATHRHGMAKARDLLLAGSPARAFLALVETTEGEASVIGYGGWELPTGDGMRRLIAHRRDRTERSVS